MAAVSFNIDAPSASLLAGNVGFLTGFEHIESVTVGSGGASSVTFSGIPQYYRHLQIRGTFSISASVDIQQRLNGDSGTNYAWHLLAGNGSSASSANLINQSQGYVGYADSGSNPSGVVVDLLDYSNTVKFKTVRTLFGRDNNGSGNLLFSSSLWRSTSSVVSWTLFPQSGNFNQHSTFSLYGVR